MPTNKEIFSSVIIAIFSSVGAGIAEYKMTGEWTALYAGLWGLGAGGLTLLLLMPWIKKSEPVITNAPIETKTWINEEEALEIVGSSAIAMQDSSRRNDPAKPMVEAFMEKYDSLYMTPSGEEAYRNAHERDIHTNILYQIIERFPSVKKKEKFSKEIIRYALSLMIVEAENLTS